MPRYLCLITETAHYEVEVEAVDEENARTNAEEAFLNEKAVLFEVSARDIEVNLIKQED